MNDFLIRKAIILTLIHISNRMHHYHQLCILSFLILTACATMKGGKKAKELRIDYNSAAEINYGYTLQVDFYAVYANGKDKKLTHKSDLKIEVTGATYSDGQLYIEGYPEQFGRDVIDLRATYSGKDDSLVKEISIPFNYRGPLKLIFTGDAGTDGKKGSKGGMEMVFRNGLNGGDGTDGAQGRDGHNLSVYIWKDESTQQYKIRVNNLEDQKSYYYNYLDSGAGITIDVSGGAGGTGGKGGDGGDGKDGRITDKKTKEPGSGGNGGNGGNGGQGGNGGMVYLFIHPNAAELQNRIAIYNFGGAGGAGGPAGDPGKAGKPLEGQEAKADGTTGLPGEPGPSGSQGNATTISIEAFDPENNE